MASGAFEDLALSLFQTGDYADVTLKCGIHDFKAHKAVICKQSDFFANAVKENTFLESQTGIIQIQDHPPHVVKAALRFLYTRSYENEDGFSMDFHLEMWNFANFIQHGELKALAEKLFIVAVSQNWNDTDAFALLVEKVYNVTSDSQEEGWRLRACVVKFALRHAHRTLAHHSQLYEVLEQVPEFTRDAAIAVKSAAFAAHANPDFVNDRHCTKCRIAFAVEDGTVGKWCPNGCKEDAKPMPIVFPIERPSSSSQSSSSSNSQQQDVTPSRQPDILDRLPPPRRSMNMVASARHRHHPYAVAATASADSSSNRDIPYLFPIPPPAPKVTYNHPSSSSSFEAAKNPLRRQPLSEGVTKRGIYVCSATRTHRFEAPICATAYNCIECNDMALLQIAVTPTGDAMEQ